MDWSGQPFPSLGIFPTQGLNPCLPLSRQILYHWATWEAYIYIFFIHSSVSGHFNILVVVNNVAMNIGVHVSLQISVFVFSDIYPRVGLLGHMIVRFLVFYIIIVLILVLLVFSMVAAPMYILTNSVWVSPFLHILASICYLCSCWWGPFWPTWGDIALWLGFAFPFWLVMLNIFSCAYWSSAFFHWKNVYSVFCIFCNWNFGVFLILSCMGCLHMSEINPLSSHIICKYLLPLSRLSFHFVDGFFCCTKTFKLN